MTCDGISRPASIDIPGFLRIPKNSRHLLNFGNTKPCCTKITSCRRVSCGHIAQVAFLPLEIWGGSPPSPRGVPIIGPRNRMCMLVQCYLQSKTQGLGRDPRIAARRDKISHPWPFTKSQLTGPAVMIALSNSENYPQLCKYFGKQH